MYEEKKKEFEERKKCEDLLVNFGGDDSDGTFSTAPGNAYVDLCFDITKTVL